MTQFMKPQIEFGRWLLVDGACGIEAVNTDWVYAPNWMKLGVDYELDCLEEDSDLRNVRDGLESYVETDLDCINTITKVEGYGARLSAPGYMDCTEWTVFETREEAEEFLREEYDVEEEETEDE